MTNDRKKVLATGPTTWVRYQCGHEARTLTRLVGLRYDEKYTERVCAVQLCEDCREQPKQSK